MSSLRSAALACAIAASTGASIGQAQTQTSVTHRDALVTALETLIATAEPGHNTHDAGQWLQLAVDDAIRRGDGEIERLAIRAASPVTARISAPVSSMENPPGLEIGTQPMLKVPRPIGYAVQIVASLDGGEFVQVLQGRSGKGWGFRVDKGLGTAAAQPGFHSLRLRAHLTFGDPAAQESPSWSEVRDLPQQFYAIYDVTSETKSNLRSLVYGPASAIARDLDPVLGDEPIAVWLTSVLSKHRGPKDPGPEWMSQYCSQRTGEAGSRPSTTAICSVMYFLGRGQIGQVWFRTADVKVGDGRIEWVPSIPPRFEGFVINGSAQESERLSALPLVLDTDPAVRPVGDVTIAPDDIVIVPPSKAGLPFAVAITVRNQGRGDLFKVAVTVAFAVTPIERGTSRLFVVDVPALSTTEIKLDAWFPNGYGFVMAHAMQISEHSPHESWTPDPTPEDACAFRIANPRAAPARYLESLGDTSGCRGK